MEQETKDKLTGLGVADDIIVKIESDLGVTKVDDLIHLTEADLTGIGMLPIPARALIKALAPAADATKNLREASMSSIHLQEPPISGTSWLSSLSAIRPQMIQPLTVLTGVKAAMADVFDKFQMPRKMMNMLREASDSIGEGVPDLYFDLQNITLSRRYGMLVPWMQGKGSACTVAERKRFLKRMHEKFWTAIDTFYNELEAWRKGRRDSMDIGEQLANAMSGEMQIYDATQVRTAAMALGDAINKVFSGTGVYASTALALDNEKIEEVLTQLDFRLFGSPSREKLLADLGSAVPPDMVSAETTIVKFVWNAMSLKDIAAGGFDEQKLLIELAAIGTGKQWNAVKDLAAKKKPTQFIDEAGSEDDDEPSLTGIGDKRKL
jgi:hypothetical protein